MVQLSDAEEKHVEKFKKLRGEVNPDKYNEWIWVGERDELMLFYEEKDDYGDFDSHITRIDTHPDSIEKDGDEYKVFFENNVYVYEIDNMGDILSVFDMDEITEDDILIAPEREHPYPMIVSHPSKPLAFFVAPML